MMRRDKVLDQMRDEGAIGEEEYREALEEKITLKQGKRGFSLPQLPQHARFGCQYTPPRTAIYKPRRHSLP